MKLILTSALILVLSFSFGQNTQILPFTGLRYQENGISGRKIEVELDENTWTSNQLTTNTSFVIKLVKPRGYKADEQGNYHPNIRVTLFNSKGDTVGHSEKFMGEDQAYDKYSLESLSLTLGFKEGTPIGKYLIKATYYDKLSTNTLDINFNVELMETVEPKPITRTEYAYTSFEGYMVKASDFEIAQVQLGKKDSITSSDKIAIPFSFIGMALPEKMFLNKDLFSVTYISESNTTDIKSQSTIKVKKVDELTSQLDVVFIIPKTSYKKDDFVRVRWTSEDKKYTLDAILKLP